MTSMMTYSCAGLFSGPGKQGVSRTPSTSSSIRAFGSSARAVASTPLGSLTIRKWTLDNGLSLITVPDAGARSVSYLTMFRVGSRNENASAGETGLAHLFEHLMFTGASAGGRPADFDQQIEEVGGSSNAMTTYDFTSYIDELPPEELDRAIALEAHRMVNLELGEKRLATEREVVVQERLGSVEDSVDGTLDEMVWGQAFKDHPYRWPIIGRMTDIKSVTRDRVLAFYRRHYAPNHAVIVVAGAFEERGALQAIEAAYGELRADSSEPDAAAVPERAPRFEVRARIQRPVPADRFVMGYPAPGLGDPDRAAYDVIDQILLGGPSSRLHRLLVVERELASSVNGDVAPTRDPGLFCLWIQMTRGHEAGRAEELIVREMERLATESVDAGELTAARNRLETEFWSELGSSRGRAEALGHFEVTTGDYRNLIERSRAYDRVTASDVRRVAGAFLAPGARSVVTASPNNAP